MSVSIATYGHNVSHAMALTLAPIITEQSILSKDPYIMTTRLTIEGKDRTLTLCATRRLRYYYVYS
jgi:hypothetical protein